MRRLQVKANLDGYTMRQLAQLFGVADDKVSRWITCGALRAERSGVPCGSGERHFIKRESVRRFILHHPEEVDTTRCEKYWLLDIVSNGKLCEEFRREVA